MVNGIIIDVCRVLWSVFQSACSLVMTVISAKVAEAIEVLYGRMQTCVYPFGDAHEMGGKMEVATS